jgi:HSP20 family protein
MLFGDLPGVSAEGLEIDFEDLQLTIRGSVPDRGSGRQFLHSEYGIGDFHRVFTLSETIDPDRISAEIRDGVVKITLPKVEQAKPRRIEVKSS